MVPLRIPRTHARTHARTPRPFPLNVCGSILTNEEGGQKCPLNYEMCTTVDPCGLGEKLNQPHDPDLAVLGCYITTSTTTGTTTTTTSTLPNHQSAVYKSTGKIPADGAAAAAEFESTCTDNAPGGMCCCVTGTFVVNVEAMTVDIVAESECDLQLEHANNVNGTGNATMVATGALGNAAPIKPPPINPGAATAAGASVLKRLAVPLIRTGPILKVENGLLIGGQKYIVELSLDIVHFTNMGTDTPLFCDGFAPIGDDPVFTVVNGGQGQSALKKKGRGGRVFLGLFLTVLILALLFVGYIKQTTGEWPFRGGNSNVSGAGAGAGAGADNGAPGEPLRAQAPPGRPAPPPAASGAAPVSYLEPTPVADADNNYETPSDLNLHMDSDAQYADITSHGNAISNDTYTGVEPTDGSNYTDVAAAPPPVAVPRPGGGNAIAQYDNAATILARADAPTTPLVPAAAPVPAARARPLPRIPPAKPPAKPPARPGAPPGRYTADSNA